MVQNWKKLIFAIFTFLDIETNSIACTIERKMYHTTYFSEIQEVISTLRFIIHISRLTV